MGRLFGGQRIAKSFTAPRPPVPVLSPALQLAGIPARRRSRPVRQFLIQSRSFLRECVTSELPTRDLFMSTSIEGGVVVSRGSLGRFEFRSGSTRSSRVI